MNILILGTTTDTGFGTVTKALTSGFLAAGHDVRIIDDSYRGNPLRGFLAGRVWPGELVSFRGFTAHAAITGALFRKFDPTDAWMPDTVLSIADMSGMYGQVHGRFDEFGTVPVFHYCPIEGDSLPPSVRDYWKVLRPVAMSTYGQGVIEAHIERPVPRVFHGVDSETFHPASVTWPLHYGNLELQTKAACKLALGLDPDRKVVLRSDRLVFRKFYDKLLDAMWPVFDRVPEVDLVVHCKPVDDELNLHEELARREGHVGRVILTGAHDTWNGLSVEGMAVLMNAADLYVSTTGGEGFGLNLAEALACEVPVIVTDWAADAEVTGPGGVLIPPLHDAYGEVVRHHSKYGMDWAVPDARAFVEPIVNLLGKPAQRRSLGAEGRRHVVRSFPWDQTVSGFLTLFEEARVQPVAV